MIEIIFHPFIFSLLIPFSFKSSVHSYQIVTSDTREKIHNKNAKYIKMENMFQ